ncbi:MAG TPA: hypothetical protein VMW64_07565, partial [Dehalococcoidia bacterium]|nr:hypothetical protein [Dehalococcoidia bacterium]
KVTVTQDGKVVAELTGSNAIVVAMQPDGGGDSTIVTEKDDLARACVLLALCVLSKVIRTKYPDLLGYLTYILQLMPPSHRCPRVLAEPPSPN